MTTPDQREQLRLSLLRFLEDNGTRFGLSLPLLTQMARNEGRRDLAPRDALTEIEYLADKGLAASVAKMISPENQTWRITAAGRDFLAAL